MTPRSPSPSLAPTSFAAASTSFAAASARVRTEAEQALRSSLRVASAAPSPDARDGARALATTIAVASAAPSHGARDGARALAGTTDTRPSELHSETVRDGARALAGTTDTRPSELHSETVRHPQADEIYWQQRLETHQVSKYALSSEAYVIAATSALIAGASHEERSVAEGLVSACHQQESVASKSLAHSGDERSEAHREQHGSLVSSSLRSSYRPPLAVPQSGRAPPQSTPAARAAQEQLPNLGATPAARATPASQEPLPRAPPAPAYAALLVPPPPLAAYPATPRGGLPNKASDDTSMGRWQPVAAASLLATSAVFDPPPSPRHAPSTMGGYSDETIDGSRSTTNWPGWPRQRGACAWRGGADTGAEVDGSPLGTAVASVAAIMSPRAASPRAVSPRAASPRATSPRAALRHEADTTPQLGMPLPSDLLGNEEPAAGAAMTSEFFAALDVDQDGMISPRELRDGVRRMLRDATACPGAAAGAASGAGARYSAPPHGSNAPILGNALSAISGSDRSPVVSASGAPRSVPVRAAAPPIAPPQLGSPNYVDYDSPQLGSQLKESETGAKRRIAELQRQHGVTASRRLSAEELATARDAADAN
eukprot:jgi/Chrpa1/5162/Chrysochromulina_OHIO_Genome00011240-RA